jgi:nitroreductase
MLPAYKRGTRNEERGTRNEERGTRNEVETIPPVTCHLSPCLTGGQLTPFTRHNPLMQETFEEAWQQRFAESAPERREELAPLARHRSIRQYSGEAVPESLVRCLVGVAQGAATSSNLQLWSIVSVQDPQTREEIAKIADNYQHIREAAWFFAFAADHHRLREAAAEVGEAAEGLDYVEFYTMAVIHAALAAERFVCAAESLGLGICYIGALRNNPAEIKRILALPEHTFAPFGLCLGWPAEDSQAKIKPRLSQEAVWFRERYGESPPIAEYDERMKAFYEQEKMKGDVTWSMRSGRRVDNHHLTGRDVLKEWLEQQGFSRR